MLWNRFLAIDVCLCGRVITVAASHARGSGFNYWSRQAFLRSVKRAAIIKQRVTAVVDCECKPQVWEERRPCVINHMKIRFTCGLTATEIDLSTTPQIRVLNCL